MTRPSIKPFIFLSIPFFIFSLILEIFFRTGLKAAEVPYFYFDPVHQILKFDASKKRSGIYTVNKFARHPSRWHVNNEGWNCDINYSVTGRTKPLVAVIGDSYVEGLNISTDKNFVNLLRDKMAGKYDFYGFGISGANLTQYLQMSRYVNRVFHPDILVVVLVHNDFENLFGDNCRQGMLCLTPVDGKRFEETIAPYKPNFIKRILRHSSVLRYLVVNLAPDIIVALRRMKSSPVLNNAEIEIERAAGDYVFQKIREENKNKRVIFIADAPRWDLYAGHPDESVYHWMNSFFAQECRKFQFEFIDLTSGFSEKYKEIPRRFEYPEDYHWNEWGHETVAGILQSVLSEKTK